MDKEKIPTLKPYDGCQHKLTLPLYARDEKNWISSQKLTGKMIYICIKPGCGALLDKGFIERKSNHSPISSEEEHSTLAGRSDTDTPSSVGHNNKEGRNNNGNK